MNDMLTLNTYSMSPLLLCEAREGETGSKHCWTREGQRPLTAAGRLRDHYDQSVIIARIVQNLMWQPVHGIMTTLF